VQKVLALILVVLGGLLLLKTFAAMWFLLFVLAAAFAVGAATGSIGKWGYTVAVLCAVFALPGLLIRTIFRGIAMAVGLTFGVLKLFPILLVIIGIYLLFKSFK
jgi:hypothetical protein